MRLLSLFVFGIVAAGCTEDGTTTPDGPVGLGYRLERTAISATPCPAFDRELANQFIWVRDASVEMGDTGAQVPATVVDEYASLAQQNDPNVVFTLIESWSSPTATASPSIEFRLWASADRLEGRAVTSFTIDTPTVGTVCAYEWAVEGFRLTLPERVVRLPRPGRSGLARSDAPLARSDVQARRGGPMVGS